MQPTGQAAAAKDKATLHAMHNIVSFHRDHMRFNAALLLEVAADLSREANKLKVFGDYWQRAAEGDAAGFDRADPRFGAAGCGDLSPLSAVAGAGILFMEGQGEPDEIRMLKEKLKSRGEGFRNKGQWLVEMMGKSWQRDRGLLDPATVEAAWPRLRVVSVTWHGAKQRWMAGKLLLVALEYLEMIEFTPAAIRQNRAAAGKLLLAAGWAMDAAAALFCKNATTLLDDDPEMAEYLAFIENQHGY
ncbi:MAG: hypothetical protein IT513_01065 [Burkholderiales bacterium]|nr:hypothetical protein [Burkholderiales bacterium]